MTKIIRGHHLLCVHGFQGKGYSPEFVEKMAEIVEQFRNAEKDFPILVRADFDEACFSCPNQGESICEASPNSQVHVTGMDKKVFRKLGIKENNIYLKSELLKRTIENVEPDDLDYICKDCSWLSYGMCKQGIGKLKEDGLSL